MIWHDRLVAVFTGEGQEESAVAERVININRVVCSEDGVTGSLLTGPVLDLSFSLATSLLPSTAVGDILEGSCFSLYVSC